MLRFVLLLALFCALSCSKEQRPTAPAGKSNCALCDMLGDGTHQAPDGSGGHTAPEDDEADEHTTPDSSSVSSPDSSSVSLPDSSSVSLPDSSSVSLPDSSSVSSGSDFSSSVFIPDTALRTYIEEVLKKSPGETISQADMDTLQRLDLRGDFDLRDHSGIENLIGLETAKNLEQLQLNFNQVSDLTPLAKLAKLRWLDLSGNQVSDLTPLAKLAELEQLQLNFNQVSDLTPLAKLAKLRVLDLASNQVSDLTPLAKLAELQVLDLSGNQVSDLIPLAKLAELRVLDLASNQVSDLIPLAKLAELRWLFFSSNQVSNLAPLRGLSNLEFLKASDNPLSKGSIKGIIPLLQNRNVVVLFSSLHLFTDTESPFSIDLVFLDDITEEEREIWHLLAKRWEAAIQTELPDYEFSGSWSGQCGFRPIDIPAGERIDDLRIYIMKFNKVLPSGRRAGGFASTKLLRSNSLPIIGCIGIDQAEGQERIARVGLHEIGHVLGIGTIWKDSGMLRDLGGDTHFAGPKAVAAFNRAGGRDYRGAKVPTEQNGHHWRAGVMYDEIMSTSGGNVVLSAITLRALSDLGYSVDLSAADPYVLPPRRSAKPVADAIPFCSLEGLPPPVYVDD